jgi:hypothetical protein
LPYIAILNTGGYIGYIMLFLRLKKKREIEGPKYMSVDNIKMDHRGVGHEASDWICVAESRLHRGFF